VDELTVRVLRAVACFRRLRIISRLVGRGELTLTQLAREVGLRRDVACVHLARLLGAGLVQRRRSGARCYYAAQSPYSEPALSGQVVAWLRDVLMGAAAPSKAGERAATGRDSAKGAPPAHKGIFQAATAFTHPRRIQILRKLAASGPATLLALTRELHMSAPAAHRHLRKLIRRGYVQAQGEGLVLSYSLAPQGGRPLETRLLEIVRGHWDAALPQS